MKEIKDIDKWRDIQCSWTGRLNIGKMSNWSRDLIQFYQYSNKDCYRLRQAYPRIIAIVFAFAKKKKEGEGRTDYT